MRTIEVAAVALLVMLVVLHLIAKATGGSAVSIGGAS